MFVLEEVLLASSNEDVDYVADLIHGFPVTGIIPSGDKGVPIEGDYTEVLDLAALHRLVQSM